MYALGFLLTTYCLLRKYQIILGQTEKGSDRLDGEISFVHLFDTWVKYSEIQQMAMYCMMWADIDPLFRRDIIVRYSFMFHRMNTTAMFRVKAWCLFHENTSHKLQVTSHKKKRPLAMGSVLCVKYAADVLN